MKKGLLIFIMLAAIGLSACGKMSASEPFAGSGYPHSYPKH